MSAINDAHIQNRDFKCFSKTVTLLDYDKTNAKQFFNREFVKMFMWLWCLVQQYTVYSLYMNSRTKEIFCVKRPRCSFSFEALRYYKEHSITRFRNCRGVGLLPVAVRKQGIEVIVFNDNF